MAYQYHVQQQAERFAQAILPVPSDYPLAEGLPADFRENFAQICATAKEIYTDMVQKPEQYGFPLVPLNAAGRFAVRDSYRAIHRFVDTLSALFTAGRVEKYGLMMETAKARTVLKKIPKYGYILDKIQEFGFVVHNNAEWVVLEYPDFPGVIAALKIYFERWEWMRINREDIKVRSHEFHHHFYRFDYKITADLPQIPMERWVSDEAEYYGMDQRQRAVYMEFYKRSLQYDDLSFDGDYYLKQKRVARLFTFGEGDVAMLKLNAMDSYTDYLQTLPARIKRVFEQDRCTMCGFQNATKDKCKYRLYWTLDGVAHRGCAYTCFQFEEPTVEDLDVFFRLLELEYGLSRG